MSTETAQPAPPAVPSPPTTLPTSTDALSALLDTPVTAPVPVPKDDKDRERRRKKANEAALALRNLHWPDVKPKELWLLDGNRGGFAQVPRTLALFTGVIKDAVKKKTGKSIAAGSTYTVLWLHIYGQGVARIDSEKEAAFEAGYGGERGSSTFRAHMHLLKSLGFIDFAEGPKGPMQYVLMLNPYQVLQKLHKEGLVEKKSFAAIIDRLHSSGSGEELKEADDAAE